MRWPPADQGRRQPLRRPHDTHPYDRRLRTRSEPIVMSSSRRRRPTRHAASSRCSACRPLRSGADGGGDRTGPDAVFSPSSPPTFGGVLMVPPGQSSPTSPSVRPSRRRPMGYGGSPLRLHRVHELRLATARRFSVLHRHRRTAGAALALQTAATLRRESDVPLCTAQVRWPTSRLSAVHGPTACGVSERPIEFFDAPSPSSGRYASPRFCSTRTSGRRRDAT